MTHGLRTTYQKHHCHCTPCRAANALRVASLRALQARGEQSLNACISVTVSAKYLRQLVDELTMATVAHLLGLKGRQVALHGRITLRLARKLHRLYRLRVSDET